MADRRTAPVSDVEQMQLNELRKLERSIRSMKGELSGLQEKATELGTGLNRRWKRYSVEFEFEPGDTQPQQQSFHVDQGQTFFCKSIGDSLRVLAQAQYPEGEFFTVGQQAQVTLGYDLHLQKQDRQRFFEYFCRIYETGTDREWQNLQFPSVFLQSGHLAPLMLPRPARIVGGSEVTVEVDPIYNRFRFSGFETFTNYRSYKLHIFFDGFEVPS